MEAESQMRKECPVCGRLVCLGNSQNGLVRFDLTPQRPANVWACEFCWYEEIYQPQTEEAPEG